MRYIILLFCVSLFSCSSNVDNEKLRSVSEKWVQDNILEFYSNSTIDTKLLNENTPQKDINNEDVRFDKDMMMSKIANEKSILNHKYSNTYNYSNTHKREGKDITIHASIADALHKSTQKGYDRLENIESSSFYTVYVPFNYVDSISGNGNETIGVILSDKFEVLNSKIGLVTKVDSVRNIEISYMDVID